MKPNNIILFAKNFWRNAFKSAIIYVMFVIFVLLTVYAAVSGAKNYEQQNTIRIEHQQKARESWEANPDKHPHRMAHFGTFAFRLKHPLSMFDYGIESFTGNAVFLEAHKQNSVNFSDASFSTGMLRFGELSMAMILQIVLPLIVFFIGFSAIVSERENGSLKILITQGASWKSILLGNSLGLFGVILIFFFPVLLITCAFLFLDKSILNSSHSWIRFVILMFSYLVFLAILSMFTIIVSASSKTSKNALLKLLGIWLVMVVLLPKTSQALGNYFFSTPSKSEFQAAIEKDVSQIGNSHNPDDPYYAKLRDSVLAAHNVERVEDLPFNYGGYVMGVGEKTSSEIYNKHYNRLVNIYQQQNSFSRFTSLLDPFISIKNLSMALSGTDYESYVDFQKQAEKYRYDLAQEMNELQMEYINPEKVSGSEGKLHVVDHEHWEEFPDFAYKFSSIKKSLSRELFAIVSLLMWVFISAILINYLTKKAKAI
ncbi:ABC transporter permease [Abyssalbus ytuae]|uniref:DUF3526 domain-containing protein n=1 Tax=Abyssalbus ytuae TaxID=2926907 RepID=A0A9E6ZQH3_9FLAO|nr:DUF3526 domain-containing protein [Abyssalbus ytuae]UOB18635.1 DUF3526 domain-containing protein [Abyssalbus ytuae]